MSDWIGPCVHDRDPWDRCETCEEAGEAQALLWALDARDAQIVALREALQGRTDSLSAHNAALWAALENASGRLEHVVGCPSRIGPNPCACGIADMEADCERALASTGQASAAFVERIRAEERERIAAWHDERRIEHEEMVNGRDDWKHIPAAAAHGASADYIRALGPKPDGGACPHDFQRGYGVAPYCRDCGIEEPHPDGGSKP